MGVSTCVKALWLAALYHAVVDAHPMADAAMTQELQDRATSYTWSYWNDNQGERVSYHNGAGGEYDVTWHATNGTGGDFLVGKGWNPGGNM
jgi:hypothetical protein